MNRQLMDQRRGQMFSKYSVYIKKSLIYPNNKRGLKFS